MIGQRTSLITSYIDNRKRDKLRGILERIGKVESVVFKDEIAGLTIDAIEDINEYPYRKFKEIEETEIAFSKDINKIIRDHRAIVNLLYDSTRHIIAEANFTSRKIAEANEAISGTSSNVNGIMKKMETELKSRGRRISIADERIFFDSFNNRNQIASSTLKVDTSSGVVTLPILNQRELDVEIRSINTNVDKLAIKDKNIVKKKNEEIIRTGFYAGKFFDEDPRFEPVDSSNNHYHGIPRDLLTLASDGDPYTCLEMEYLTDRYDVTFQVEIDVSIGSPGDVQMITVSTNNQGSSTNVNVEKVEATLNNYYVDYTENIYGKGLAIGNVVLPSGSRAIELTGNEPFPRDNLYMLGINTMGFKVTLSQNAHIDCNYPIVRLEDKAGNVVRKLNYLESLIVLNRVSEEGTFDFNKLATYDKIITPQDRHSRIEVETQTINRYLIAVRDIQAYSIDFGNSGELTTQWYEVPEGIAGVEIYPDEYIYPSLSVSSLRYFIGIDNDYYEIWPYNRRADSVLPKRFVFGEAEITEKSKKISDRYPTSLRLLVRASGGPRVSPILHSYALRIKMRSSL